MKNKIDVIRAAGMALLVFALGGIQIAYAEIEGSEPTLKQVIEQPDKEEVASEKDQKNTVPSKPLGPVDKLNRGVPRSAIAGYFSAVKAQNFETAAEYLDLRNLPKGYNKNDGPELAHHLKVVLDRTLWVDMDTLSSEPNGHKDDGFVNSGMKMYQMARQKCTS